MKSRIILILIIFLLGSFAIRCENLGIPHQTDLHLQKKGFLLGYNYSYRQAVWVAYTLTAENLQAKQVRRRDKFRADPEVKNHPVHPKDYARSGFDKGHLAPAADMAYSEQTMRDSFYMSNISPQRPGFNRGIWKNLEAWVRQTAVKERLVVVVTGPVFPGRDIQTIGKNAVTVPTHFYKIVYDLTPPKKMIAFILPNEKSDKPLRAFAVSVDAVERLTGLDFFSKVPLPEQNEMEKSYSITAWYGL